MLLRKEVEDKQKTKEKFSQQLGLPDSKNITLQIMKKSLINQLEGEVHKNKVRRFTVT